MLAEHWPAGALGVIGQKEPAAVASGEVDRGMAPVLGSPGGARAAGLHIGIVRAGQAEVGQALLAALQHAVQRGQIFAVLDGVLGALEDLFYGVVRQRLKP